MGVKTRIVPLRDMRIYSLVFTDLEVLFHHHHPKFPGRHCILALLGAHIRQHLLLISMWEQDLLVEPTVLGQLDLFIQSMRLMKMSPCTTRRRKLA
jgi:hypothetical protein